MTTTDTPTETCPDTIPLDWTTAPPTAENHPALDPSSEDRDPPKLRVRFRRRRFLSRPGPWEVSQPDDAAKIRRIVRGWANGDDGWIEWITVPSGRIEIVQLRDISTMEILPS